MKIMLESDSRSCYNVLSCCTYREESGHEKRRLEKDILSVAYRICIFGTSYFAVFFDSAIGADSSVCEMDDGRAYASDLRGSDGVFVKDAV